MNGNSKKERLEYLIKRAVRNALMELAWEQPASAAWMKENADRIRNYVAYEMTSATPYSMREIQDVMDWKKPKGEV